MLRGLAQANQKSERDPKNFVHMSDYAPIRLSDADTYYFSGRGSGRRSEGRGHEEGKRERFCRA